MAAGRSTELALVIVIVGILTGIGLVLSEPSNRQLILIGSAFFLSLFLIKPEKILLIYLAITPLIDLLIPIFSRSRMGPQILIRGGLLVLLAFYWVTSTRNPLSFKPARPIFFLIILVLISAITFAGHKDTKEEISSIGKLFFWFFLLIAVADMTAQGKIEIKWIYRCVAIALLLSMFSLEVASLMGISRRAGKYGVGEFGGAFGGFHTLAIGLSIGIIPVIGLATKQRKMIPLVFLLILSGLVMVSIMRTYVRTGYVTFVAGFFMLHFMLWRKRRYAAARRQRAALTGISLVLIAISVFYSITHFEALKIRFSDLSGAGRTDVWLTALRFYAGYHPLYKVIGWGFKGGVRFYKETFTFTHNGYLFFLLSYGLVGLSFYIWILISLWRAVQQTYSDDYLPAVIGGAAIMAFAVAEMVNGATFYLSATTYFSFIVGGAIGHYRMKRSQYLEDAKNYEESLLDSKAVLNVSSSAVSNEQA